MATLDPELAEGRHILCARLERLIAECKAALRDEALEALQRTRFLIPRLPIQELEAEALASYRGAGPSRSARWRPPLPVRLRLMVNHLRHGRSD